MKTGVRYAALQRLSRLFNDNVVTDEVRHEDINAVKDLAVDELVILAWPEISKALRQSTIEGSNRPDPGGVY